MLALRQRRAYNLCREHVPQPITAHDEGGAHRTDLSTAHRWPRRYERLEARVTYGPAHKEMREDNVSDSDSSQLMQHAKKVHTSKGQI